MNGAPPVWPDGNLESHHQKRLNKDAGCFEQLMGINPRSMTAEEYKERSIAAFQGAWAEYEGEGRDVEGQTYSDSAAYFVDDALVVAITDTFGHNFITCFHEHFGRRHGSSQAERGCQTLGGRRLRYKDYLKFKEQNGMIRNVQRIRGV